MNGRTGATTRTVVERQDHRVRSASVSPFQKRGRERRMYQFDRSSTKVSKARITLTVRYGS